MQKSDLITYRSFQPTDEGFIYSTWIQGYQGGHQWLRRVPRKLFWNHYRPIVEYLVKTNQVKMACLLKNPDTIIGYCVFKDQLVHWIHIKENWRKIGIAKDLLPANFSSVTHMTNVAFQILKKYPKIIYNPFLGDS